MREGRRERDTYVGDGGHKIGTEESKMMCIHVIMCTCTTLKSCVT